MMTLCRKNNDEGYRDGHMRGRCQVSAAAGGTQDRHRIRRAEHVVPLAMADGRWPMGKNGAILYRQYLLGTTRYLVYIYLIPGSRCMFTGWFKHKTPNSFSPMSRPFLRETLKFAHVFIVPLPTLVDNRLPLSTLWRENDPSLLRVSKILGPDCLVNMRHHTNVQSVRLRTLWQPMSYFITLGGQ